MNIENDSVVLSEAESKVFLDSIDKPFTPNDKLKRVFEETEHQKRERFRFASISEKQKILTEAGMEAPDAFRSALIADSLIAKDAQHRQGKLF